MSNNEEMNLAVNQLIDVWSELVNCLIQHPEKLSNNQLSYWQAYQGLFHELAETSEENNDKRFQHTAWHNNILFDFIRKSYLLASKHIEELIKDVSLHENKDIANKLQFFTRLYLDAISPSNFVGSNPEILAKMSETNGDNLVAGFRQLLADIERGNGHLQIQMTDLNAFTLGENIACTPGKIIYQNELIQLIQYTATTNKVYQVPLLIIPPWINKYYILDLQQENSLVKWLVDQGLTVFMISWVNPGSLHKEKQFADYMLAGPLSALKIIKQISNVNQVNVLGYCIGGTLLGCMLAYLAKKQDSTVRSATFLTTLLDFSEPGELGNFTSEKQIHLLENHMQVTGFLDGRIMASVFNALRANDLIWASFVNNYLKGQKPKAFDLLYWNADSTNIPAHVHSFYLRNMYLHNSLIQKNKIKLAGKPLDLQAIKIPSYFLATHDDHIVPWKTSFRGSQFLGGDSKFVLASAGHVAGVINPPSKMKYGYWINDKKCDSPDQFLTDACFTKGSWWFDWFTWLQQYAGNRQEANIITVHKKKSLENAPGSYVKIKVTDITEEETT